MKNHNTCAQKWLWVVLLTIVLVSGCITPEPENLVREQTRPSPAVVAAPLLEATPTLEWFLVTPSPLPPPPSSTPRITPTAPAPITETHAYDPQLPLRAENITLNTVYSLAVGTDITFKSWSPDGEKFLFGRVNQRYILVQFLNGAAANGFWDDLWVANIDGTYQHQLSELVNDWAWSPDGQQVAYLIPAGEQGVEGYLYVVNLDDLHSTKIADCDLGSMDDIFWLPTDEITCRQHGVLYATVSDGSQSRKVNDIFSTASITDTLTKEMLPPVFQGYYRISPDGNKIAYTVRGKAGLWIANLDGSNATQVIESQFGMTTVRWSPDSTRLVYSAPNGEGRIGHDLWAIDADGSHSQRVTITELEDAECTDPTWSPDGQVIAYAYRANSTSQPESVWVINADGTHPHLLIDLAFAPQWSIRGNEMAALRVAYDRSLDIDESLHVLLNLGQ